MVFLIPIDSASFPIDSASFPINSASFPIVLFRSVEVGKDADFSLFDGDPLDLAVTAKAVAVGGVMYRY